MNDSGYREKILGAVEGVYGEGFKVHLYVGGIQPKHSAKIQRVLEEKGVKLVLMDEVVEALLDHRQEYSKDPVMQFIVHLRKKKGGRSVAVKAAKGRKKRREEVQSEGSSIYQSRGVSEETYNLAVSEGSKDYASLARLVSGRRELTCPRCSHPLLLRLKRDDSKRGMWFTASFLCPSCDLGGEA